MSAVACPGSQGSASPGRQKLSEVELIQRHMDEAGKAHGVKRNTRNPASGASGSALRTYKLRGKSLEGWKRDVVDPGSVEVYR